MNHSDKYKLIFFHLAKCAGKSVAKAIGMDIHHQDHVKANLANFTIIDSKGKEVDLKDIPNIDVTAITGVAMDDIGVQGQQMLPVKISADHKVMKKGNETVDKEQYTIYSTRKANASLYDGLHD